MKSKDLLKKIGDRSVQKSVPNEIPRGWRNNNPLNIRRDPRNDWLGKVTMGVVDPEFEEFVGLKYGVRAALLLMSVYYFKYKARTLAQYIALWAPRSENNTNAYIDQVCLRTGYSPTRELCLYDKFEVRKVFLAMACVELGAMFLSPANGYFEDLDAAFSQGWDMYLDELRSRRMFRKEVW